MSLNWARARQLLADGDLRSLFIDALGWDHYTTPLDITIDGSILTLPALAHKRGMVAYQCATPSAQSLADYAQRRKIEHQVGKAAHEHLIVFTDAANQTQIWQWVKREPGKPAACRERTFHRSQPGDALVQKLEAIAFTLEEEERLSLTDVTRRTRAGFDVERVTKRFYDRFQKEHTAFLRFITGITDRADHEWYASVMMNRLMFVYFIQRKGFLDNDRDYLRNRLNRMRNAHGEDKFYSFYRYFLLRLFHEGLGGRQRSPELEKLIGRIPYLDGGIFDVHELERPDRYGKSIQIPDDAFEHIFDYFDQYQWHLDERPLRADNEINPDVLGYIFEKYINQKQMGAYYTKEDITEYISKNTVVPFLFDAARSKCKVAFENPKGPTVWDILKDDPDRYIYEPVRHGVTWNYIPRDPNQGEPLAHPLELPLDIAAGLNPPSLQQPVGDGPVQTLELRKGWNKTAPAEYGLPTETWREVVARRRRYEEIKAKLGAGEVRDVNDLITLNLDIRQFAQDVIENCEGPELLRAFWHAIEKVTILDPTCGSGAFLFAALNILEPLYEACLDRMQAFVEDLERSGEKHRPEKFSDFRKVLAHVAAHPNRRYFILKSIILNNLFGVDIMEEAVEICKLRLFLKLAAQVEPDTARGNLGIEPLPDIDFNIRAGNTLVGYATYDEVLKQAEGDWVREQAIESIKITAADLQQPFDAFRARQVEGDGSVPTEDKQKLRRRLNALGDELDCYLATEYGVEPSKKDAYAKWLKSHQPFHWFVEFYGIMSGGGFDVIIGNPPYVEYAKVKADYRVVESTYSCLQCGNLYALVLERCCRMINGNARVGMIVQLSAICTDRMQPLQVVYRRSFTSIWAACYDDRPAKLFDGLEHIRATIILSHHGAGTAMHICTTNLLRWYSEYRDGVFQLLRFGPVSDVCISGSFPKLGDPALGSTIRRARAMPSTMESVHRLGSPDAVYYYRSPLYWIRSMNFLPHFDSGAASRSVHHFKDFGLRDKRLAPIVGCVINSTTFYTWFMAYGNGRNVAIRDVTTFPGPNSLFTDESATEFRCSPG
ncbi:MAG: SAM-dependent methyltransferase [Pseudomonadota bacterium]|nr:SAM-dependent methyltransferase [Pseudomonadota bacterium]